jgi:hypothetical protein
MHAVLTDSSASNELAPVQAHAPLLFSPNVIACAAFLATPLAGAGLLSCNLHRTKRHTEAKAMAVGGVVLTLAMIALAVFTSIPQAALSGATIGAAISLRSYAAKAFPEPRANASAVSAILISLAALVVTLGCIFVFSVLEPESKVSFPDNVSAYYENGATEYDARRVGEFLIHAKYLEKDTEVRVSRERPGRVRLSFSVREGLWNDAALVADFQTLANRLANEVFLLTVDVVLTSDLGIEKKRLEARATQVQ